MFKVIGGLIVVLSTSAFAQYGSSEMKIKQPRSFNVTLDGASVLLKGVGVKATYSLSDKFSVGGLVKSFEMSEQKEDKAIGYEYTHKVNVIGAVVDFFPFSSIQENGIYLSAAVTSANVSTSVEDSYFGSDSAKDSSSGGQVTAGYQFLVPLQGIFSGKDSFALMFHAGLGYGNAGQVRWSYSGKRTELENSVLLDLYAGAQF